MGLTANTGPYNAAAEHYGVDDPVMTKIPRSRFQFLIRMTLGVENAIDPSYGNPFVFHRVQGVNLPDYNFNVMRVNQYNRMRYITTRMEINPFSIVFYDTKDSQFQNLLLAYARHYYSQGLNMQTSVLRDNSTTNPNNQTAFGVNAVPVSQRYFFDKIEIISTDTATSGRVISAHNCMITSVGHDNLDYRDSEFVTWNVQFQPEHVNIYSSSVSNGSIQEQGAASVIPPYDVTRSAAAGILVNAAGEVLRDASGSTISFNDIVRTSGNSFDRSTDFVFNGSSGLRFDINGNPVTLQDIVSFANDPIGTVVNRTIGNVVGNVTSGLRNAARSILPF
jgi:hypothetical protein